MTVSVVPAPQPARSLEWQGEDLIDPVEAFRRRRWAQGASLLDPAGGQTVAAWPEQH